jgi:hypothetical protein
VKRASSTGTAAAIATWPAESQNLPICDAIQERSHSSRCPLVNATDG